MYTYATLAQAKAEQKAQSTADDAYMLSLLRSETARFERECGRVFVPVIDTRYFDAIGDHHIYNGKKRLLLRDDLLEATTVTDGSGTVLVSGTDYRLHERGKTPAYALQGLSSYAGWHQYTSDPYDAISIVGVWGYHKDYANAWRDSGQDVTDTISASATSFAVNDADIVDPYTQVAMFSPGQLLKVEDEYMTLLDVNTNTLTVQRGVNGSTAVEHTSPNLDVYIWQVMPEVQRVVYRAAAYRYSRRAIYEQAVFDSVIQATVSYPKDVEAEWQNAVLRFSRNVWMGI